MMSIDQQPLLLEPRNSYDQENSTSEERRTLRCSLFQFDGVKEAKSVAIASIARGLILVSAIFISSSILNLARISAGCADVLDTCDNKIYGFKPSSLITMITFVSGILTALMMPIIGSVLEYTSWRRALGIVSAFLIWIIQTTEIGTNKSTWLFISIIQSISGFLYNVQLLTLSSYLPYIGRKVGEDKMADYAAMFNAGLFITCMSFLILVNATVAGLGFEDVRTVQISQFFEFILLPPLFYFAWKHLPHVPTQCSLDPDQTLLRAGFTLTWDTAININVTYKDGLRYFFIATIFSEAGMSAFSSISLVYMIETLGATSLQVSIIFGLVFLSIVPGSFLGAVITKKMNPISSWKTSILLFSVTTTFGALILTRPERIHFAYIFGILWGILMGWFYSIEDLIFSLSLPDSEESRLTGFFIYCRNILSWLPPLLFTALNEIGVSMQWGLMSLVGFYFIAVLFLELMAPWEKVLEKARSSS